MTHLSDDAIRAYAANIFDLEDDREQVQTDLKEAWSHIREAHGKRFADSLKLAVKRARMDADKRQASDEIDAEAERIIGILNQSSRVARGARTREDVPEHDADGVITEQAKPHFISAFAIGHNEPDAAVRPQTVTATMPVLNAPELASVESSASHSEPVTIPPVADPATVVTEAGDGDSASSLAAVPVATNVTPFRHNPKTHFLNSKGLLRLHGCLKPETCGGSHRALCFSCSTQHEGPAHQDGAA